MCLKRCQLSNKKIKTRTWLFFSVATILTYVKFLPFFPRSRLENTNEDWGSLLASLRELTDWVTFHIWTVMLEQSRAAAQSMKNYVLKENIILLMVRWSWKRESCRTWLPSEEMRRPSGTSRWTGAGGVIKQGVLKGNYPARSLKKELFNKSPLYSKIP